MEGQIKKILISGKRCSGKTTLFWNLQKALNWPTFAVSLYLRDYMHRFNLTPSDMDAKSREISHDIDSRVVALLGTEDHVIIDARVFGGICDAYAMTLKVLLLADDDIRIKRAAYREKTSEDKQKKRLLPKENKWVQKMQHLYGYDDFYQPKYYDLVINTNSMTPEQICDAVLVRL